MEKEGQLETSAMDFAMSCSNAQRIRVMKCAQHIGKNKNNKKDIIYVLNSLTLVITTPAFFSKNLDSDIFPRITDNHTNATPRGALAFY